MRCGYEVFHPQVGTLVDFYVRVLGFTVVGDGQPVRGYVAVRRDDIQIGCCEHPDATPARRKPPLGSEIVLRVNDIRAEHDRAVASGWPLDDGLQQRPWGLMDFRLFDPSGQYIRVTEAASD